MTEEGCFTARTFERERERRQVRLLLRHLLHFTRAAEEFARTADRCVPFDAPPAWPSVSGDRDCEWRRDDLARALADGEHLDTPLPELLPRLADAAHAHAALVHRIAVTLRDAETMGVGSDAYRQREAAHRERIVAEQRAQREAERARGPKEYCKCHADRPADEPYPIWTERGPRGEHRVFCADCTLQLHHRTVKRFGYDDVWINV